MNMGRQRTVSEGLPDNLHFDSFHQRYRYTNPETGERTWLSGDRTKSCELARKANTLLAARRAIQTAPGGKTLEYGIDMYIENVVPHKAWDDGTRKNALFRLNAIKREIGHRYIVTIDRIFLKTWIDARSNNGDVFNKWRDRLVDLWEYFIELLWVDYNEPAAIMKRSTSKKLKENRRIRHRLELDGFWAIHDHETGPAFLQIAMELSILLLQARKEVCDIKTSDFRDGWLYIIRDKVAADSDMAFIRIQVNAQLKDIRRRAFEDDIATEYLVHRHPTRQKATDRAVKPHWAAINPAYLTRAFKTVRDATGLWDDLAPRERPSLHEIVSLGVRTYRKAGYPKDYIQALKTHSNAKTTDIYLQGEELTDDHYRPVEAGLTLAELRQLGKKPR